MARSVAGRPPGHPTRSPRVPETAAGVRAAVCAAGSAGAIVVHPFYAPLCVPVWMSVRAGGRVEAVAALETRMAGTSGSGLCGMQVWAHDSAVTHVCGGCRTAPGSRG